MSRAKTNTKALHISCSEHKNDINIHAHKKQETKEADNVNEKSKNSHKLFTLTLRNDIDIMSVSSDHVYGGRHAVTLVLV